MLHVNPMLSNDQKTLSKEEEVVHQDQRSKMVDQYGQELQDQNLQVSEAFSFGLASAGHPKPNRRMGATSNQAGQYRPSQAPGDDAVLRTVHGGGRRCRLCGLHLFADEVFVILLFAS